MSSLTKLTSNKFDRKDIYDVDQLDKDKDKDIQRTHPKSGPEILVHLRHLIRVMGRHESIAGGITGPSLLKCN